MIPLVLPLMIAMVGVVLYLTVDSRIGLAIPVLGSILGTLSCPALHRATARNLERRTYRLLHTFRSTKPT